MSMVTLVSTSPSQPPAMPSSPRSESGTQAIMPYSCDSSYWHLTVSASQWRSRARSRSARYSRACFTSAASPTAGATRARPPQSRHHLGAIRLAVALGAPDQRVGVHVVHFGADLGPQQGVVEGAGVHAHGGVADQADPGSSQGALGRGGAAEGKRPRQGVLVVHRASQAGDG